MFQVKLLRPKADITDIWVIASFHLRRNFVFDFLILSQLHFNVWFASS